MKLEDIDKKNIYSVPDKYFDQLPGRIQTRIHAQSPKAFFALNWQLTYKIAAPALAMVLIVSYFWYNGPTSTQSPESLLAQVSTEELVAYLETTDISMDEILETVDFENVDLDLSEETPIIQDFEITDESINTILDEFTMDDESL